MGKIKMGGSAVMEFEPDYCEFHITVSIQKDTSSEALSRGRQRVEEILQLLTEKAGLKIEDITLTDESVSFSNYSTEKRYRYTKSFSFNYKNDNEVTDMIVKLLEKIDNTEYHLNFSFDDEAEKNQMVMMAAVANAREKAEKLANALGTTINGFEEINYEFRENSDTEAGRFRKLSKSVSVENFDKSLASQMGNRKIMISKNIDVIWLTE